MLVMCWLHATGDGSMRTVHLVEATFFVPGRLTSLNRERAKSRWVRAADTATWREAAALVFADRFGRGKPIRDAIIAAVPHQKKGRLADTGNHYPSVKAVIDGLQDVGVLVEDSPKYLRVIELHAPVRAEREGLLVKVIGERISSG